MRVHPWVTAVASLLLAGGSLAHAQSPPPEYGYFPGTPGVMAPNCPPGMPGCEPGLAAGAMAGGAGAFGAGHEIYAWPKISPYEDYPFSQHYVDKGLWHWEGNNARRQYILDVDGLFAKFRGPERVLIGQRGVPPADVQEIAFPPMTADVMRRGFGQFLVSDRAFADERRGDREPIEGGLRLTWGFFDPDETGLAFSGWGATEANWFFQRGTNGNPSDFNTPRLAGGLPVNDGGVGVTIPYDRLYRLDFSSVGAGADMTVHMTPRWKSSWYRLQPLWGMRYVFIHESFGFLGRDTGAGYIMVFPPGRVLDPNTFVNVVPPYEGNVHSDVTSHVFGPEVGIRYTLGRGNHFRLVGDSRIGVAANFERLRLDGYGIGDGFSPDFIQNSPFERAEKHGHLSPVTFHSINAEMRILGLVPIIKKIYLLERATFRAGWSILYVGEVARPTHIIEWNGLPLYPNIQTRRTHWHVQGYHVGLHFEY